MPSATAIRFNQLATIDHFDSKDGVMTVTAIARSPGVLTYRNADGSERRELVSREFLRRLDANGEPLIGKLGGVPVTLEHPTDGLIRNDDDRLKRYKVGETHKQIHVFDTGDVQVTFDVFDPETQDDIKFGRRDGVSVGYLTNVKHEPGTWHGQHFDAMQDEPFDVDHLAVCRKPRAAGAKIKAFKFDSAEVADIAWQVDSVEPQESASAETTAQPQGEQRMGREHEVTVGNRPIVLDSADDAEAINSLIAKVESLQTKLDAKKQAEEDDEDEDYDDEEDEDDDEPKGKKMPPWLKGKMAKKDSLIEELEERIDSLATEVEIKDARISVLETIAVRADSEEETETEHLDADTIAAEVQTRLDAMFSVYEDAKPYLPADFKLDGNTTPSSIQAAALTSLGDDFKLDSEDPAAIAGAYEAMKRFASKRQDSGSQLERLAIASSVHGDGREDSLRSVKSMYENAWKGGN